MSGTALRTTRTRKIVILCAIVIAGWSILPVYWIVNLSLETRLTVFSVPAPIFPLHPNFDGYLAVLRSLTSMTQTGSGPGVHFREGVVNSLFVATMVMVFTMILSVPAGYGLARFRFSLRTTIFLVIIFVRSVPPISILVPLYNFYKITNLGGTYQGIILADMTLTVPLIAWVTAGIFASIPKEIDKQGRVDGCSRYKVILKVLVPVAAPGLIVVAVLSWVTSWNEWLFALYLGDAQGLRLVSPLVSPSGGSGSAFLVVSMIPAVIAAIILQRYMTRLNIIAPTTGMADYGIGHPNS